MGTSSDGILFFGIDLGDDEDREKFLPWETEDGEGVWEDFVVAKLGAKPPKDLRDNRTAAGEAAYDTYTKSRDIMLKSIGCSVEYHGGSECVAQCVYLNTKYASASRGGPINIDEDFLNITQDDIETVKEFCRLLGLEEEEPHWVLTSWLG